MIYRDAHFYQKKSMANLSRINTAYLFFIFNWLWRWLSIPYRNPPTKTTAAPTITPGLSLFPNSQMLSSRDTSLRMLSTMVTVSADEMDPRMFTPRIHTYCVSEFSTRNSSWRGIRSMALLAEGGRNACGERGSESKSRTNCDWIDRHRNRKSGSESACCLRC